jgi:hypothetical protein
MFPWHGKGISYYFMGVKLGVFYEGTLRLHSVALSSIKGKVTPKQAYVALRGPGN